MPVRKVILNSHEDLTPELREMLTNYYEENDHRPINNDSYSRYPMYCDFDDEDYDKLDPLVNYLKDNDIITDKDYCVIIHWEW